MYSFFACFSGLCLREDEEDDMFGCGVQSACRRWYTVSLVQLCDPFADRVMAGE
jgi:hypothetical protein